MREREGWWALRCGREGGRARLRGGGGGMGIGIVGFFGSGLVSEVIITD